MGITNKYQRVPLEKIHVERDERQRREIDTTDLDDSIRARGVIQPIIVELRSDGKYQLIAGERRFTSSTKIGLKDIPCRLAQDLSPIERQILELEENVKRKDLDWKDEVKAVQKIHTLYCQLTDGWTQTQTASSIGFSQAIVAMMLRVAEELALGNKIILQATGYRPAYNIIARREGIRIDDAMNDLLSEGLDIVEPIDKAAIEADQTLMQLTDGTTAFAFDAAKLSPTELEQLLVNSKKPGAITLLKDPTAIQPLTLPDSIVQTDFVAWSANYSGKPFSFIHCDFPYGINLDKSEQGNTKAWGGYDDSEATYWKLNTALARNLDRLMMQSGHLMFWLSADINMIQRTISFFSQHAPSLEFIPMPLIWQKTDGRGILSDPKRRARHVYETALIASRGDRHILRSVADAYGAPTAKEYHQSEKPEPVLRHFFQMFVDENTRMLDPTCGSGTSIRAAESLGASFVFGLEINPDFVAAARTALKKSRLLRTADKIRKEAQV